MWMSNVVRGCLADLTQTLHYNPNHVLIWGLTYLQLHLTTDPDTFTHRRQNHVSDIGSIDLN